LSALIIIFFDFFVYFFSIAPKSLGTDYTEESLQRRIRENKKYESRVEEKISTAKGVAKDFYLAQKAVVILFYERRKYPKRVNKNVPFFITNDHHINELARALKIINALGITEATDIIGNIDALNRRVSELQKQVKTLANENGKLKDAREKASYYYNNNPATANQMTRLRFAAAKEILDEYGINSPADLAKLEHRAKDFDGEKAWLEKEIGTVQERITSLAKIAELHESVKDGSYIQRLVRLELQRQSEERAGAKSGGEEKIERPAAQIQTQTERPTAPENQNQSDRPAWRGAGAKK
jgi:hypothetical protein